MVVVLVVAQVMKCELSEDLHSKNLNVLIIGLISGGRGGAGEEGGGGGGGGEVVIWRLVAGPCGAAMGSHSKPNEAVQFHRSPSCRPAALSHVTPSCCRSNPPTTCF